jgi:deazaflavin-dependent oxidoreductase (nitroreductase family)
MSQENFLFPQILPYPESWLVKQLYKIPTLLYRLGLGKLYGNYVLILSTKGRKTGKIHRTPVEYFLHEGRYYIISGFGEQTDWYKNISASPLVTLQNGYERICAEGRPPQTDEEWDAVHLYLTRSPIGRLFMADHFENVQDDDLMLVVKQLPVLTFDPTDKPCPVPLETDLLWAWPLILLGAAFDITALWLLRRRKKT